VSIIESKASRLLSEGRVTVLEAGCGRPGRAVVVGDHGRYEVEFGRGNIVCHCPAWTRRCSHARAVQLVVEDVA
jgi:hypothetical protein